MSDKDIKQNEAQIEAEEARPVENDPGMESLKNALAKTFVVLKVIMAFVIVAFIASGVFSVEQNERAIRLRFGAVTGDILEPGLHWAFPEPIDEIVVLPVTKSQTLEIDKLWYNETEREKLTGNKRRPGPTLNPLEDGYCLTRNENVVGSTGGDYNIVHSKWMLTYTIDYPEKFFRNVYVAEAKPGQDVLAVMQDSIEPMLEALTMDAITATLLQYTIDDAIVSKSSISEDAAMLLQEKLNDIDTGIDVESLRVAGQITWPRQVDQAFQRSNQAKQESDAMISQARGYARRILSETGGAGAETILADLQGDELDGEQRAELLTQLAGKSQEVIADARAHKTNIVEAAKANANYLTQLLPEYRKRPELVLQRIYQDAVEEVLDNAQEKIIVQPGKEGTDRQLRILINRDPARVRNNDDEQGQGR
ncbi:Modulator of FtsH protease HflK [Anaerohalosphaera lusitana]|uniref:Modulator of FtsH protease HflK n=1 Tax=Anaerohalosphaera lusitana TaxID=1936003 RepID=A0A1U9NM91_9BACT|nr:SPFH domain-containing protein [Anaerohalosphaera lusitana]AQT68854.1 Modulator of FtsH protease HflK [Anaerohalosphaera lusitana]